MDGYVVSLLIGQTPSPALFKSQPGDASRAVVALGNEQCIAMVIAERDAGGGLWRVGDQIAGSGGQGDLSSSQASYGFTVEDKFAVHQKSILDGRKFLLEVFCWKKLKQFRREGCRVAGQEQSASTPFHKRKQCGLLLRCEKLGGTAFKDHRVKVCILGWLGRKTDVLCSISGEIEAME